ncbi:hypothetical protein GCM10017566_28890 [Amycolatopsis bartoniae]|uniref:Uncharacterized protein n=1 Tax=Amycolatopsis bartoniae TaxID=941986 RepID=A0A8H9MA24_9PSEU|nr:hypothetical protein GCM10017566_28890 [Amycolatopsis bartoniae]
MVLQPGFGGDERAAVPHGQLCTGDREPPDQRKEFLPEELGPVIGALALATSPSSGQYGKAKVRC